jgi:hypothetical protein
MVPRLIYAELVVKNPYPLKARLYLHQNYIVSGMEAM